MKIRNLLFIILPLLFLFNGTISLLLFNSSHRVNESYAALHQSLIVYESIDQTTTQGVQLANQWLTSQAEEDQQSLDQIIHQLEQHIEQLALIAPPDSAEAEAISFMRLINSYHSLVQTISAANPADSYILTTNIDEAELLSSYISEESHRLVSVQLAVYEQRFHVILEEISNLRTAGIVLLISSTLLCLWLSYSLSRSITKPIQELVHTATQIAQGNLDFPVASYSEQSDFYSLSNAFTQMQNELKRYIASEKETLQKDKQLKEMELEVLKSQINPHFLFNSLNVMSKLALIEGAERTSDLTVAISNLLRYNLKKLDTPVPLLDEVKHAQDYFYIQQARYRERIQFRTEIDEAQLKTTVPVLTLQPLLENIFVHGIEHLEHHAAISLVIKGDEQFTWITISDNGIGMEEHTVQQLLQYDDHVAVTSSQAQSTGLGTRNVFRRLQLLYGEAHHVDIKSRPGQGTSITLRIPKPRED